MLYTLRHMPKKDMLTRRANGASFEKKFVMKGRRMLNGIRIVLMNDTDSREKFSCRKMQKSEKVDEKCYLPLWLDKLAKDSLGWWRARSIL